VTAAPLAVRNLYKPLQHPLTLLLPLLPICCPAEMLGFEAYFVKWCAVIMAGFVLAFMVAIVAALRIFNFQRR
jgi:hypothetical protein